MRIMPGIEDKSRPGLWGFLVAALLLHAALLLAPLRREVNEPEAAATLEVSLSRRSRNPVRFLDPARLSRPEPPPGPGLEPSDEPDDEPAATLPGAEPDLPPVSRLLDQVARMEWIAPNKAAGPIGRPVNSRLYTRISKPVLEPNTGVFDTWFAPSSVEVTDRWLEPGGVHRVVVRTPTGHTLCGRQEALDVFRPWLQMPMLFHTCGGGGERRSP